jgi:F-type H+-transporting ATPase subunit epsilon
MNQELPSSIHLRVFFPDRQVIDENVQEVFLPSLEGSIGILPGHRPLLALLGDGLMSFQAGNKKKEMPIQGGYAEILSDGVLVFTKPAKDSDERIHE